jgi:hypothetical protein
MTLQPGLKDQIRDAQLKGMQGRFNEKGEYVNPIGAPAEDPAADGDAPMAPMKGTTEDPPPTPPMNDTGTAPASPPPAPATGTQPGKKAP